MTDWRQAAVVPEKAGLDAAAMGSIAASIPADQHVLLACEAYCFEMVGWDAPMATVFLTNPAQDAFVRCVEFRESDPSRRQPKVVSAIFVRSRLKKCEIRLPTSRMCRAKASMAGTTSSQYGAGSGTRWDRRPRLAGACINGKEML